MRRERVLQVVLAVVGVLFTAGIYPLAMRLLHPQKCEYSDVMLLSLYVTLASSCLSRSGAHRRIAA